MRSTVFSSNRGARDASGRPRTPLRYTIDAAAGVTFVDLLDLRDPTAVVAAIREMHDDSAYRQDFGILLECCYLRSLPSADGIRALARACFEQCRLELGGPVAIVAGGDDANAGARFFAILTAAPRDQLRVFSAFSEALAWLCPQRDHVTASGEVSWAARADVLHDAARRARLAHP